MYFVKDSDQGWKMAQELKHLPHKQQDQSLDP